MLLILEQQGVVARPNVTNFIFILTWHDSLWSLRWKRLTWTTLLPSLRTPVNQRGVFSISIITISPLISQWIHCFSINQQRFKDVNCWRSARWRKLWRGKKGRSHSSWDQRYHDLDPGTPKVLPSCSIITVTKSLNEEFDRSFSCCQSSSPEYP